MELLRLGDGEKIIRLGRDESPKLSTLLPTLQLKNIRCAYKNERERLWIDLSMHHGGSTDGGGRGGLSVCNLVGSVRVRERKPQPAIVFMSCIAVGTDSAAPLPLYPTSHFKV